MDINRLIRKFRPHLLSWLCRSRSGQVSLLKHFSYKDIKRATDSFHRIIYGNSRCVAYKARFCDGDIALVKEVKGFDQRDDMFEKELQLLVKLHHRHILGLRGFSAGKKRLLVFNNIENGSLKERLNDPLKTPLNWRTRLRIASGVTAALEYLLRFNSPPTYHVSVNSGSIMLDQNFTPKLSDVGLLSSLGDYAAMSNDSCSEDSVDQLCGNIIFQLGVLILELITGQSSEGSTDLIQWIKEYRFGSSIHKMIDPDLGNSYNSRELKSLLAIARLCINSGSSSKVSVLQIFRYIQKKVDIQCN